MIDILRCWLRHPHLITISAGVRVCTHCFNELEEH